MNEKEIERLIKLHADSLGDSTKRVRIPHRVPWRRNIAVGMASIAVVTTITLTLWPRDVVAGTVARINKQILNASTFKTKISMESASGWHTAMEIYCAGNMRRIDKSKESPLLAQTYIEKDGLQYSSLDCQDFTTVSKMAHNAGGIGAADGYSVLDIAKQELGVGIGDRSDNSTQIQDHEPVDGRSTYLVVMEQPSNHTHLEILVEKETDRPIRAEMQSPNPRTNKMQRYKAEYEVNKPIAASMFEAAPNRELVQLPEDSKLLENNWSKPVAAIEGTEIRSATRLGDGTIWLAVTVKLNSELANLPSAVFDDSGVEYARTIDLTPTQGMGADVHLFNEDIVLCGFVPLKNVPGGASSITVNFSKRDVGFVEPRKKEIPLAEAVLVDPELIGGESPAYFKYLGLSHVMNTLSQVVWSTRAKALEQHEKYLEAALAYDKLAEARYRWVKYSAFEPMLSEARTYRKLGQIQRADELELKAEALKQSQER